jgi:uronate dehydrogenase
MRPQRLLITGAAGRLGSHLRHSLKPHVATMRLSDIAAMAPAGDAEEVIACDLADKGGVDRLVRGCDAIVHLGGIPNEQPFERIVETNIKGIVHLYEAARRHEVRRVVYASSNHVVGFHRQDEVLDTACDRRPDGFYGLSKSFGEDVARLYFDRWGIESACLRIGSCFPEPVDRRMLHTWLSHRDLTELVRCCLAAPRLGFRILWGVSAHRDLWWHDQANADLGFHPVDSSEPFRERLEQLPPLDPSDPAHVYQGGAFVKLGPFDNGA